MVTDIDVVLLAGRYLTALFLCLLFLAACRAEVPFAGASARYLRRKSDAISDSKDSNAVLVLGKSTPLPRQSLCLL